MPSDAAMRVADKFCNITPKKVHNIPDADIMQKTVRWWIADFIDRETGLSELIAACELAFDLLAHNDLAVDADAGGDHGLSGLLESLEAAIAKAKGGDA